MKLPKQAPPVHRAAQLHDAHQDHHGVEASATKCSRLHGMARQICYATRYGIRI